MTAHASPARAHQWPGDAGRGQSLEVRDYLKILGAYARGVVIIVMLVVLLTAAYTFTRSKVYVADASGFVSTGAIDNPALGPQNDQLARSRATSYVDIAKSRATAKQVITDLGLDVDPAGLVSRITVDQPLNTVLLKITARGGTPRDAQTLADAWVAALAKRVAAIEDPGGSSQDGTPRVIPVESAEFPSRPISPNPTRNLALGLIAGLLLALGYALLRHNLDRRIRTADAVEERFGVPVVSSVPTAVSLGRDPASRAHLVVSDADKVPFDEGSRAALEAFRKLRTNLTYMNVDAPPRIIVVTSPRPGDGKSTVAANLAAAVAFSGQPVVLVDGDLRRPSVASAVGVLGDIGLTDVLVGSIEVDDALQLSAEHPNLLVLAAGRIPPNPSELLGSQTMKSTLAHLAARGTIVIDAPPLLPVADAAILTAQADGALVVVSAGKTLDSDLSTALSNLHAVNGRPLGVILNRTDRRAHGGYHYEDYYAPAHEAERRRPAAAIRKRAGV